MSRGPPGAHRAVVGEQPRERFVERGVRPPHLADEVERAQVPPQLAVGLRGRRLQVVDGERRGTGAPPGLGDPVDDVAGGPAGRVGPGDRGAGRAVVDAAGDQRVPRRGRPVHRARVPAPGAVLDRPGDRREARRVERPETAGGPRVPEPGRAGVERERPRPGGEPEPEALVERALRGRERRDRGAGAHRLGEVVDEQRPQQATAAVRGPDADRGDRVGGHLAARHGHRRVPGAQGGHRGRVGGLVDPAQALPGVRRRHRRDLLGPRPGPQERRHHGPDPGRGVRVRGALRERGHEPVDLPGHAGPMAGLTAGRWPRAARRRRRSRGRGCRAPCTPRRPRARAAGTPPAPARGSRPTCCPASG